MTIETLRASVRPTLAVSSWAATITFMATNVTIPDAWWALVSAISTFYFVSRHDEKKAEREREEARRAKREEEQRPVKT